MSVLSAVVRHLTLRRGASLLPAATLAAATGLLWFAANAARQHGTLVLILVGTPAVIGSVITTLACWRASKAPQLPPHTARFWWHQTIAVTFVALGTLLGAAHVVVPQSGVAPTEPPPSASAAYAAAMLTLLWSLYRLPVSAPTRGQRVMVWLDAATVMLGTGVFMWHFFTRPHLADPVAGSDWWMLVLILTAVFAVAKVALSNDGSIERRSLHLFAVALLSGSLGTAPQRTFMEHPRLNPILYVVPIVLCFVTWAAERQRTARPAAEPPRRRRPFSVLPYGAVVTVDGLLLFLVWSGSRDDLRPVAMGAVVLTGLVVVRQVTAYRENGRLLARLHHGATHDALTQLPNRALFAERLASALASEVTGRPLSVVLIDLDDFKGINDALGHGIGDALLISVGSRLAGCVGPRDTVARLGGDEFVVVLEGMDPAGADLVVGRLMTTFAEPVVAAGHELLVSASVGIADGRAGDDAAELLRQADVAMYAAKRQGGASFAHYEPGMADGPSDNAHLGAELRMALAGEDELFLLYQPIVDLDGGRLDGVEALVRWAHPARGVIGPIEFIPVAERTGLIVPLGRWVLREAARQAAAWNAEFGDAAPRVMNVNVSARELRESDFPAFVASVLAESGLIPGHLVLEITETTVFALGASVANLHAVRAMGIRIALDDFGTGQSTLTLLQDCPVDELKLDRSFTQADTAAARNTMAVAVIHLAHALGLGVVAEGVETPQQAERLRALGYPWAQGYYFAKPMAASEIAGVVSARLRARAESAARVALAH
jgi:diguanylate cyclase (GGDEF)-like protein